MSNYGRGKFCYDCNFGHTPAECGSNPKNKEKKEIANPELVIVLDANGDAKKTRIKKLEKWGLLQRVALPDKPWGLCIFSNSVFDTELAAYKQANEYNTHDGKPAYLYKPVELLMTAAVPLERSKE